MKEHRPLGWTTLEEAKLLVEAGLDPNTADMHIIDRTDEHGGYFDTALCYSKWDAEHIDGYYPCWSLGALIDLMPMFEYNRIKIPFGAHVVSTGEIVLQYFTADTGESIVAKKGKEFIDAVISMILWLLKNNNIKKQE